MNVLLICVNYDSDESLVEYISSIEAAHERCPRIATLRVVVVDNTQGPRRAPLADKLGTRSFALEVVTAPANLGYVGGVRYGLEAPGLKPEEWDYVIVSNVDIVLDAGFFDNLPQGVADNIGILAPSITSSNTGSDMNPFFARRPARLRMWFYTWLFARPARVGAYHALTGYVKRLRSGTGNRIKAPDQSGGHGRRIYAPHGSFLVFTRRYFEKGGDFQYPVFLFNEEIYFAEASRDLGLEIVHDPQLKVIHKEHDSMAREPSPRITAYHRDAARYVYSRYFR